jgi:hypothetical protein
MTDPDQERTLRLLAHAIRHCVKTLGPACSARLLARIARDLADSHRGQSDLARRLAQHKTPLTRPSIGPRHDTVDIRGRGGWRRRHRTWRRPSS